MSAIGEINTLLEKIPLWKRLTTLPREVEELRERLAKLEAKFQQPVGEVCRKCREPRAMFIESRPHPTFGDLGMLLDTYTCSSCSYSEERERTQ